MGVAYNPAVVMSGMMLYLDASNTASYPGTGTSVFDLIAGNTHSLNGSASYTVLNGIPCFDCTVNGNNMSPVVPNQLQLPTTGYTYVAWARIKSDNTGYRTLYRTTPDDHPLLTQIGSNLLGMWDNNGTGFNSSGYDITSFNSVWCQWTVVGSTALGSTFYINDAQAGSSVALSAAGNFHNFIGGVSATQAFGHIATVMLYNRVLTLPEIAQNFTALRGRYGV